MHRWVPGASACAWFLSFAAAPAPTAAAVPASSSGDISSPADPLASRSFSATAEYLQGIAALDRGRVEEAVAALRRAVASQPDFSGARMELARAQFESGRYSQAREEFQYLLTQSPPEQARSVIRRYLDAIPGQRVFATSRWSGTAQIGAGHDSNANGSTSDPTFLGFTLSPRNVETASSFGELMLAGGHSMLLGPSVGLVTNLQLTHRSNTDASFVDQSVATLGTALVWSRGEYRFSGGVEGYAGWLDLEDNERGLNFNASASRRFGDYEGAVSLRAGSLEYERPSMGILDADRFLAGLSVSRADLGGRPLRAGIALLAGTDDAKQAGSPYGNDRFGARLFGSWQLRPDSFVSAELSNMSTDYDGSFFGARRKDEQLGVTLSFDRQDFPAAGWSIAPRLRYLRNDSNIALYEYDRVEAMVFVRRSFQGAARGRSAVRNGYAVRVAESEEGRQGAVDVGVPARSAEADASVDLVETIQSHESAPISDSVAQATSPVQPILGESPLGLLVDLTDPRLFLQEPQISTAISVPASGWPAFAASSTDHRNTLVFNSSGSLVQFNEPFGTGSSASDATYLSGTGATVDFGSNGTSGIRWGRWSTGAASINTIAGVQSVNLQNASLHWVAGPAFEAPPVLPVSGSIPFVLAGGTSPTDNAGHTGSLGAGTLIADFTAQHVSTELSLEINGYNWFAKGSGSLESGSVRFSGSFNNVLVDGRIPGSGAFSGFLSAGAISPDQLNGAGLSYWLTSSAQVLGTISGVAGFVPGAVQPLAPPTIDRDVAYASGIIDNTKIVGGVAANSREQLTVDANGDLRRFQAPVPHALMGTLGIGMASVVNTGKDAATGIRWGRWEGGAVDVTTPPGSAVSIDLTGKSLHWIAGNEFGGPPLMPQTGTATYTLIGNTDPTDTLGNVGVLGAASLNADFTNRLVSSEMTFNVGGLEWYAKGSGTFPIAGHRFIGSYDDVRIQNLARGQGMMYGFFTLPRIGSGTAAGAGLSYSLTDNAGQMGVLSGVLAFAEGGPGATVTPPALQQRDIAIVSPDFAANETFVERATPADYTLDATFSLTSLPGRSSANPAEPVRYGVGTSAIAESDVSPLVMLRWGRWTGGAVDVTNLVTNISHTVGLSNKSMHWVESGDSEAPPVIPQFGTANYAVIGATPPTDRAGNIGFLHNATLSADFTNQHVSASLDLTVNQVNVVATGVGTIGALGGLPAHHFSGAINGGVISTTQGTPQGTFSGFFSGPGGTVPGVPGGAGLTYSITDGQGLFIIDGAAAFRGP